jgi:hypothetical protein
MPKLARGQANTEQAHFLCRIERFKKSSPGALGGGVVGRMADSRPCSGCVKNRDPNSRSRHGSSHQAGTWRLGSEQGKSAELRTETRLKVKQGREVHP